MPPAATFPVFAAAALALLLIPGPSVLFVVARSVEHGRRAGLISVLGIHAASLVHVLAAAAGLSALLVSSALAFSAVKYCGAAYLIVLGARRWRRSAWAGDGQARTTRPDRLFRQGFVVNLLNPKTALFFLAFLPQFVALERGHVTTQVIVLGLTFIALGIVSDGTYALAASSFGRWVKGSVRAARAEPLVSGTICAGLGVATALSGGEVAHA